MQGLALTVMVEIIDAMGTAEQATKLYMLMQPMRRRPSIDPGLHHFHPIRGSVNASDNLEAPGVVDVTSICV